MTFGVEFGEGGGTMGFVTVDSLISATSGDDQRRQDLRRMKTVATGLLLAVTVLFVIVRIVGDDRGVAGYVGAFAEAAMVGALADWFAVTALFRHPLGIPIPHTAIIPNRKDQIGRSLGEFVQGNFLTADIVTDRLAGIDVGRRAGQWLAEPANAKKGGRAIADAVRGVIEVLDDEDVQRGLEQLVVRRLKAQPVAPLVGRVIDSAVASGYQQRVFDSVLKGLGTFLEDNRATFRDRLSHESPWWVPEPLDDRVFKKVFRGVQNFITDVRANPEHEVRATLDTRLTEFVQRLRTDPELLARGEDIKEELLAHPDVQAWLGSLWGELRGSLLDAVDDPSSDLRKRVESGLTAAGRRLVNDEELQAKIDDWVLRGVVYVVDNYRGEMAELISSTVERWDAADTARRIELQVGRDLQFIRINGTVVGGLAGVLIHAIGSVL